MYQAIARYAEVPLTGHLKNCSPVTREIHLGAVVLRGPVEMAIWLSLFWMLVGWHSQASAKGCSQLLAAYLAR